MSEFPNFNLALGIIGTITGIIALFISYWTLENQRPKIKVNVLRSKHGYNHKFYTHKGEENRFVLDLYFEVCNSGERGTSVNEVVATFIDNGKEYSLRGETLTRNRETGYHKIWVGPHETVGVSTGLSESLELNQKEIIEWSLSIRHTHGVIRTNTTSKLEE